MQIATWNVNSIAARLAHVTTWLRTTQVDVLCLQELKCTDDKFPRSEFEQLGYHVATHGQRTYNGVAILARHQLEDIARGFKLNAATSLDELTTDDLTANEFDDSQARLIAATICGVRVIDVYCPNGQSVGSSKYEYKLNWFRRLQNYIETQCGRDDAVVLCGDFNIAPDDRDVHDPVVWRGRVLVSDAERAAFEELKEWGLSDAFRLQHDAGGAFSWWDYRGGDFQRNAGLRIDHLLISDNLRNRLKRVWIDTEPRTWQRPSDHAPVVAEFEED